MRLPELSQVLRPASPCTSDVLYAGKSRSVSSRRFVPYARAVRSVEPARSGYPPRRLERICHPCNDHPPGAKARVALPKIEPITDGGNTSSALYGSMHICRIEHRRSGSIASAFLRHFAVLPMCARAPPSALTSARCLGMHWHREAHLTDASRASVSGSPSARTKSKLASSGNCWGRPAPISRFACATTAGLSAKDSCHTKRDDSGSM